MNFFSFKTTEHNLCSRVNFYRLASRKKEKLDPAHCFLYKIQRLRVSLKTSSTLMKKIDMVFLFNFVYNEKTWLKLEKPIVRKMPSQLNAKCEARKV